MPTDKNLLVAVATTRPPAWAFVESLLQLRVPAGWTWTMHRAGPLGVDTARNLLVEMFLQTQDEWMLMVDDDAVFHPLTAIRLLSWSRPLVGALAFKRYENCLPTVMRGKDPKGTGYAIRITQVRDWIHEHKELATSNPVVLRPRPPDALVPVDRTGCHCVLIHRSVLEAMEPPWFKGKPPKYNQEDFYFFEHAIKAGFTPHVDLSCMTAHLYGERPAAGLDFLVWDQVSVYNELNEPEE